MHVQHTAADQEWVLEGAVDQPPEIENMASVTGLGPVAKVEVEGNASLQSRPVRPRLTGRIEAVESPALAEVFLVRAERGDCGSDARATPGMTSDVQVAEREPRGGRRNA